MPEPFSPVQRLAALVFGLWLLPVGVMWGFVGTVGVGNDCYGCNDMVLAAMGICGLLSGLSTASAAFLSLGTAASGSRRQWRAVGLLLLLALACLGVWLLLADYR